MDHYIDSKRILQREPTRGSLSFLWKPEHQVEYIIIMNQLVLTHLWLDEGLLMGRDREHGLLVLTTESNFFAGPQDSLKLGWSLSPSGTRFRKVRGKKKCWAPLPVFELVELTRAFGLQRGADSFTKTYKQPLS